jgi:hypothetical protein
MVYCVRANVLTLSFGADGLLHNCSMHCFIANGMIQKGE